MTYNDVNNDRRKSCECMLPAPKVPCQELDYSRRYITDNKCIFYNTLTIILFNHSLPTKLSYYELIIYYFLDYTIIYNVSVCIGKMTFI